MSFKENKARMKILFIIDIYEEIKLFELAFVSCAEDILLFNLKVNIVTPFTKEIEEIISYFPAINVTISSEMMEGIWIKNNTIILPKTLLLIKEDDVITPSHPLVITKRILLVPNNNFEEMRDTFTNILRQTIN